MTNEYAFPSTHPDVSTLGMTLRDWFAGQALTGILSSENRLIDADHYALISYQVADAMIKERCK